MQNNPTDEKYREVKQRIAAIIAENKLLHAEIVELRRERDYWQGIAQTGGRG